MKKHFLFQHPSLREPAFLFCLVLLLLIALGAIFGPSLTPYSDAQVSAAQFAAPESAHWCGTDIHGRDLLTRIFYGARISLLVGLLGATVSLTIGVTYGAVAGYVGGAMDNVMMRFVDILYSLPRLVFVIVLVTAVERPATKLIAQLGLSWFFVDTRLVLLFIGLGLVEWLTMARIIRGQVLVLREQSFVQAAVALGQSHATILRRHLLPNLTGIILVYLTLTIPIIILEESFLSFLGLGVQAPHASWGSLIANAAQFINPIKIYWWLLVFPGAAMALTLLSLNFIGDSLRDAFDPRSKKSR